MDNTPKPQESLALYVKRIRTSLGISQTELALKAGIHLQSLGKIERAMTTKLNSKSQRGLAYALQIPSEYLDAAVRGTPIGAVLLRKLGNYSRKNRLYQAFQELGRVIRTVFLLQYISDMKLRQQITAATNIVESYNGFKGVVFLWWFWGYC